MLKAYSSSGLIISGAPQQPGVGHAIVKTPAEAAAMVLTMLFGAIFRVRLLAESARYRFPE